MKGVGTSTVARNRCSGLQIAEGGLAHIRPDSEAFLHDLRRRIRCSLYGSKPLRMQRLEAAKPQ